MVNILEMLAQAIGAGEGRPASRPGSPFHAPTQFENYLEKVGDQDYARRLNDYAFRAGMLNGSRGSYGALAPMLGAGMSNALETQQREDTIQLSKDEQRRAEARKQFYNWIQMQHALGKGQGSVRKEGRWQKIGRSINPETGKEQWLVQNDVTGETKYLEGEAVAGTKDEQRVRPMQVTGTQGGRKVVKGLDPFTGQVLWQEDAGEVKSGSSAAKTDKPPANLFSQWLQAKGYDWQTLSPADRQQVTAEYNDEKREREIENEVRKEDLLAARKRDIPVEALAKAEQRHRFGQMFAQFLNEYTPEDLAKFDKWQRHMQAQWVPGTQYLVDDPKLIDMAQKLDAVMTEFVNLRSGAAVTPQEYQRLEKVMPQMKDMAINPKRFWSRLESAMETFGDIAITHSMALDRSYKVPDVISVDSFMASLGPAAKYIKPKVVVPQGEGNKPVTTAPTATSGEVGGVLWELESE